MGQNTNIGAQAALTVYGNPDSFISLIRNHGQLAKVKQTLICPCVATNHGSPAIHCSLCNGDGYIFRHQRNFNIFDEDTPSCSGALTPFWVPVTSVQKVQNVTSEVQGGIVDLTVVNFDDTTINVSGITNDHQKKRVSYTFDGWSESEDERLLIDLTYPGTPASGGVMTASGTTYDAEYQSSNPLNAFSDIAEVVRIWNERTGEDLLNYTVEGNTIITSEAIEPPNMLISYNSADLTQVIPADIATNKRIEIWTQELSSGECKMAFYPYWELARGDIVTLVGTVLYRNETLTHRGIRDKLWELDIYDINEIIIDDAGNTYNIDVDYIQRGRYISWISGNKPIDGATISVRYGYKPSFIIFEDNPQPNNLENRQYPVIVFVKSWSKISKDDIRKLINI